MFWKKDTIGITKSDILALITIVKNINTINSNDLLDDTYKSKRIFDILEDYSSVVDDCDNISNILINSNNIDYTAIKLIEEL